MTVERSESTTPGYLIRATRRVIHLWFPKPHRDHDDAVMSLCNKWRSVEDVDYNVAASMKWCNRCARYRAGHAQSQLQEPKA